MRHLRTVTLGVLLVSPIAPWLGGCALSPAQQRREALVRDAHGFHDHVRWGRWEQATAALPRDEGLLFLERARLLEEDLVMADSELISMKPGADGESGTASVRFEWYLQHDQTIRRTFVEQQWRLLDGRWTVVTQKRVRGERFPLILEPKATPSP